jgi:hypothetical protein
VPSGLWDTEEYDKLPQYDRETGEQPHSVFMCHQQDGRLCAGWVGCHDMEESLGLRVALARGLLSEQDYQATLDYSTKVELFDSGAAAATHGLRELAQPGERAVRTIQKLRQRALR